MYIEAIPLVSSLDARGLTYRVPEDLAKTIVRGCLVIVPVRDRIEIAVVGEIDIYDDREGIRSIESIVSSYPVLHPYQIDLAYRIARRLYLRISVVISIFLPSPIIDRLVKYAGIDIAHAPAPLPTNHHTTPPEYRFAGDTMTFDRALDSIIADSIPSVLYFPDDRLLDTFLVRHTNIAERAVVCRQADTPARRYRQYIRLMLGDAEWVIGTRRTLWLPLGHFTRLWYIEDALMTEHHLHLHTLRYGEVLRMMTDMGNISVSWLSTVPSIREVYFALSRGITMTTV